MRDSRINFRSRELAAMLAFLVPGAGHFYQGRNLKAGIFFCGILSLFFGGMILGDGNLSIAKWRMLFAGTPHCRCNRQKLRSERVIRLAMRPKF